MPVDPAVPVKARKKARPKAATSSARRRFSPAIPERYQHLLGGLVGVDLLKALYFLNEGERIGREGSQVADRLQAISAGVAALLECARQSKQELSEPRTLPFPQSRAAGTPPKIESEDAEAVRKYALAYAGGDKRLANAAYARVMDDAEHGGKLNSRWQTMIESIVDTMRENMGGRAPVPVDDPLLADENAADEDEAEYDDGT